MSVRRSCSRRRTPRTNGTKVVWPGRRRYPAAPGCRLAMIGSIRHRPREFMPPRSASPTSCWPFHSPPREEMASRTSGPSRAGYGYTHGIAATDGPGPAAAGRPGRRHGAADLLRGCHRRPTTLCYLHLSAVTAIGSSASRLDGWAAKAGKGRPQRAIGTCTHDPRRTSSRHLLSGRWWSRLNGRARSRQCRGDGESLR
jgi:hypothetical protein